MEDEIFQESPRRKALWLAEMEKKMPVGTKVRVVRAADDDEAPYRGQCGVVVKHCTGTNGEWPYLCVRFDARPANGHEVECFYDDQLEVR